MKEQRPLQSESNDIIIRARQLRLATVTNLWRQDLLTEEDAKEVLCAPLKPGDPSTFYDDSSLLGLPDALEQIRAEADNYTA